jgi:hypothetical protein
MTGSPTGRITKDNDFIMEMMKSMQKMPLPRYLRETMAVLSESAEKAVMAMDFSKLEDRTVALLCRAGPDGVVVFDQIKLYDGIQGRKATMCIMDDLEPRVADGATLYEDIAKLFERPFYTPKTYVREQIIEHRELLDLPERLYEEPMKQNGRSASYLALDPTKKNINKRRKK